MCLKTTLILIFSLLLVQGFAQDLILKTNKDTISCHVKEIGDDEIKYTLPEHREDLLFGIDKNKVAEIVFEDGKRLEIANSMYDPAQYEDQKKNAIKIGFLSPLFQATNFSFEHSLAPGKSIEATVGIIGLGVSLADVEASGVYFKFGYKFIKDPDFYLKGMRYAHKLKGAYFRPEIAFSSYKRESGMDYSDNYNQNGDVIVGGLINREKNNMFAVLLNVGKQWVIQDQFLIDWFVGVGYGFGDNNSDEGLHYAFIGAIDEFPLAITSGIRIGVLIK